MSIDLRHGRWQDVMQDVTCDLFCIDAPYSDRTHKAYRDQAELRRRPISYDALTPEGVHEIVQSWSPRTRGWFCTMTDHVLAPHWEAALEAAGRYVFSPLSCVEPGSRVRQTGDGPAQWAVQLVVARPRSQPYSKWGALPGSYVVPPGHGRAREKSEQRIGGKPVWLMRSIVRDYSRPGDVVCDAFGGHFTTALAALLEGRSAISCEVDAETCAIGKRRIERALAQQPLFTAPATEPVQEGLGL